MKEKLKDIANIPEPIPELDDVFFKEADLYDGEKLIRRGRPKAAQTKQAISIRLDKEVLDALRALGAGWQTRVNDILREQLLS
ncbi:MAG: BrnA antitoxin family protein [Pelistega sp.]|nr:BrnA antitoxin family protein [Pelistega sp.]